MGTGEILLVSLGLVLHLFEMTVKAGATQAAMRRRKILFFGCIFALVELALVAAGFVVMWFLERVLPLEIQRGLPMAGSFILLFLLGVYEFSQFRRKDDFEESRGEGLQAKKCVADGIRMGLLAFVVGLGGYYIYPGKAVSVAGIWLALCLTAFAGLGYGYWYGWKGRGLSAVCGCVFMAAALGVAFAG
ncbi:hypothetical protein H9X85_06420 [Anaerotignum lactatifermentans]|uniref:Manganese efflux pump MntP n=1 Tax=Anaerotignum lactatifermentans TaxID=160404 RepID=A0ABS2G9N0_9FIRM|nr:hypothetical protein [Anaerotignum lactatifermentans]MBM6829272.1 hypothetical protein [Anaerotignum lactatifermentans]MBM6877488.1 hypothetical protein [Anaerotignum lactatifermentans]MBM6950850.1 hypothetical protein [Anaerotignum lactatifermentans]